MKYDLRREPEASEAGKKPKMYSFGGKPKAPKASPGPRVKAVPADPNRSGRPVKVPGRGKPGGMTTLPGPAERPQKRLLVRVKSGPEEE